MSRVPASQFPPDWRWRPPLWREAGGWPGADEVPQVLSIVPHAVLFHDGSPATVTARQCGTETDPGLALEIGAFAGSYLSFVLRLPPEGIARLGPKHVVRFDFAAESARPMDFFTRLNVEHGVSVARIVCRPAKAVAEDDGRNILSAEFDLAFAGLSTRAITAAWIDLFIEHPARSKVCLSAFAVDRRPRAEL